MDRRSIMLIFEELFENSTRNQLEDHFQIFSDWLDQYGLKDKEASRFMETQLDYCCTRMCRSIMRQLSTSRDIQLKGMIQCLLSSVLPLNHRTGLNISGRFNVQKNNSNIQTFEQVNQELKKLGSFSIRSEEYKLYNNFWSL